MPLRPPRERDCEGERQKCHHIRCRRRIRRFGRRKGKTTDGGDAVKTAADKNKWGESRLKKQSGGREGVGAEQLRKNSVLSAVKLFILRDRLVEEIVKNEKSLSSLRQLLRYELLLGKFPLDPCYSLSPLDVLP